METDRESTSLNPVRTLPSEAQSDRRDNLIGKKLEGQPTLSVSAFPFFFSATTPPLAGYNQEPGTREHD